MELLKKLKNHYEKVLLGFVLVGLAIAVILLPLILSRERAALEAMRVDRSSKVPKPLAPVDMSNFETSLQRVGSHVVYDFTRNHNLFNPVVWQKSSDGRVIKAGQGHEPGAEMVEVTDIKPLYLSLTFNSPSANGYLIGVEQQAAASPSKRFKHETFVTKDTKNDIFVLRDVKDVPNKPTKLILELNDTGEAATITTNTPYKRVDGYMADLKYATENKIWRNQRRDAPLNFAGGQYKIVAITQTNVVISANSNDKKTTINFNAVTMP